MTEKGPEDKDLSFIRDLLHKAADVRDPKEMWFVVRDALNLLTMIVCFRPMTPAEVAVATHETLPG